MSDTRLQSWLAEAAKAKSKGDLEKAASLYSQAIELQAAGVSTQADLVELYELLDNRYDCFRLVNDKAKCTLDLEAMAEIAEKLGDTSRQVQVMLYQAEQVADQSKMDEALQICEKALQLARQAGDKQRTADSLEEMGRGFIEVSNFNRAQVCAEQALLIYQDLGDLNGEANVLCMRARILSHLGQMAQAQTCAQRAIEIYRQTGNREGEANTFNIYSLNLADAARIRDYTERAAVIFEEIGDRSHLAHTYNNLGVTYDGLGLYSRAIEYERRAVEMQRKDRVSLWLSYSLDSLARSFLEIGDYRQARQYYEEGLELAYAIGNPDTAAFYNCGLGRLALKLGDLTQARQRLQKSVQLFGQEASPEQAYALAWLGVACLALGDLPAARQYSDQAVALLGSGDNYGGELPPQDIWWLRYRVLTTKIIADGGVVDAAGESDISSEAWEALDRAYVAMFSRVASLSDEGLRRNYFNKREINRQIIQEWLKQGARRGVDQAQLLDQLGGRGDLPGQLKRMLEIGVRLNARRDAAELPGFIMDEVVELSGAERAALFLLDDAGQRQVAAVSLPRDAGERDQAELLEEIDSFLDEVTRKQAPIFQFTPEGAAVIKQRSILCVPLVAQARLVGLIYADLGGNFGRFTPQDRDLLNVLANQAAVAVENAGWAATLEKRVADRTAEVEAANRALSQRVSELAIINEIGQALASKLEYQEIINLVGDRLCEVFKTQDLGIRLYDREHNLVSYPYEIEHGQRLDIEPIEPFGFNKYVLATMETVVVNHDMEQTLQAYGGHLLPGTEMEKSFMAVPVVVGNQATGVVVRSDYDHEDAFSEADVRLMQTLASSLGVALENARLYQETQRRANEMAALAKVGREISTTLDLPTVLHSISTYARDLLAADTSAVFMLQPDRTSLLPIAAVGDSAPAVMQLKLEVGQGIVGCIVRDGKADRVADTFHDPRCRVY